MSESRIQSAACEPARSEEELPGDDWDTAARVSGLLDVVQNFAALDFSESAPVGTGGDDLDALAAGINMLGEEIEAFHLDLEQRVTERTTELKALTERLEAEIAERRDAEIRLEQLYAEQQSWVEHLRWLNEQIAHLTEMSNLLQVADNREEALAILGEFGPQVFPETQGEVFVFVASRDVLELVARWGPRTELAPTLPPEGCWALRRGRLHRGRGEEGLRCRHTPLGTATQTLCVPLTAQGQTLGLIALRWGDGPGANTATQEREVQEASHREYERLALATGEQLALALANLELRAALHSQSIRDPLTSLYNRRYLDETFNRELRRADREQSSVSFLMLDIDRFKPFNDTYGHAAGDAVLRQVADLVLEVIRTEDVACRYGGEELAVVMAGIDHGQALERAEQIRAAISERPFVWHEQTLGSLTVSIGVSTYPGHGDTPDRLVRVADTALYEAKTGGRDQVVGATPPDRDTPR